MIRRHQNGFTLIELVVAVAIFSVIGIGSWKLLNQVISTQSKIEVASYRLQNLQKGFWIISRDLNNLSSRSVRIEYSQTEAALTTVKPQYELTFTRSGWPNPTKQNRGSLQRVAYRIGLLSATDNSGPHLIRDFWPVLDRTRETPMYSQILIRDVDHLELSFHDREGIPRSYWPVNLSESALNELPSSITLGIHSTHFGTLERIFSLPSQEQIRL